MQCKIHPEENGVNTCNQCGTWLCENCSFERSGRIFCPHCVAQQADASTGTSRPSGPSAEAGGSYGRGAGKRVNGALLFILSVVLPGSHYMYMGLVKRGLLAMAAFFGANYLGIMFSTGGNWRFGILFFLALPVIWVSSVADGFRIRDRLNAGEIVNDDIEDILAFFRRNKIFFAGLVLVLVAIRIIPFFIGIAHVVVPVLLAVWAIKVLFKK